MASKANSSRLERRLEELRKSVPGNDRCADCGASQPRWASATLGIFICVQCASLHRAIGTHISRVKSLTLDVWDKEQVQVMEKWGNVKANALYNPDPAKHVPPLTVDHDSRSSQMQHWIALKYRDKAFMQQAPKPELTTSTAYGKTLAEVTRKVDTRMTTATSLTHPHVAITSPALSSSRSSQSSSSAASLASSNLASIALTSPSTSQSSFASDGAASYRSKTAPLPETVRTASPALISVADTSQSTYNPFIRQMSASATLPAACAQISCPTSPFASRNPYASQTLPLYADTQMMPNANQPAPSALQFPSVGHAPSVHQQIPIMSGIMADLAGLSIATPSAQLSPTNATTQSSQIPQSNLYTFRLRPAFTPQSSFGQTLASNMNAHGNSLGSHTVSDTTSAISTRCVLAQPAFASRNPYMSSGPQAPQAALAFPHSFEQQYGP